MTYLKANSKVPKNIVEKATSFALATILITSLFVGLIPISIMPAAAATTYMTVSSTRIGTNNTVKITIDDPSLTDHPNVVIAAGTNSSSLENNLLLTPLGEWILFIANDTSALTALANPPSVVNGSVTDKSKQEDSTTSFIETLLLQDQTGAGASSVTLTYVERNEVITLTVGETNVANAVADRTSVPPNGKVIVTVSDPTENQDPTAKDTSNKGGSGNADYNYSLTVSINGVPQTFYTDYGNFTETGNDTGNFTLTIDLSDSAFGEVNGDLVSIIVADDDNSLITTSVDVTITASDGLISSLATITYGETLTLTLNDADRNLNTLSKETPAANFDVITVVATIGTTAVPGNLSVTETDKNTGVFTGKVKIAIGASAAVSGNDTSTLTFTVPVGSAASFVATYDDPVSVTSSWSSEARFSLTRTAATIVFDKTAYLPNPTSIPAQLTITEPDANDDDTKIEILKITNASSLGSLTWLNVNHTDSKQFVGKLNITQTRSGSTTLLNYTGLVNKTLIETGKNTGVFKLTFDLQDDLGGNRTSGDTITAKYYDSFNKVTVTASATIGGTLATISLDRTVLPLPVGKQVTITVTVNDPDANSNPAAVDSASVTLTAKNATNQALRFNTSTSLTITVTETGADTNTFTGTFKYNVKSNTGIVNVTVGTSWYNLTNTGSNTDVQGRQMVAGSFTVSYTEPLATGGKVTATGTITPSTATLAVSPSPVNLNGSLTFTLTEPDQDISLTTKDTVSITIYNGTGSQGTLTLTETDVNTGVFTASKRAGDQSPLTGFSAGDTVTAKYTDSATSDSYYGVGLATTSLSVSATISSNDAVITIDSTTYGPFSKVTVNVTDPDLALLSASEVKLDLIQTSQQEIFKYATKKLSDGTFQWTIQLFVTGQTTGDIATALVDTITIFYVDNKTASGATGVIMTVSASITSDTGTISVSPSAILVGEFLTVTVTDVDRNKLPAVIESVTVKVTTDSWPLGKNITLPETSVTSGVFEAKIKLVSGLPATDKNEVRATTGDTLTVLYIDIWNSEGKRESITTTALVGISVPPTQRVPASTPETVDTLGNAVESPSVNTVTVIQAEVCNNDTASHTFTFFVQIKDANGVVIAINWIQDFTLAAGACAKPGISWTPTNTGTYTIEVFVWESIANPIALSPVFSKTVTVV